MRRLSSTTKISLTRCLMLAVSLIVSITLAVQAQEKTKPPHGIVHDSEFQRLWEQKGQQWATEDKEIEQKLDELRQKHGKRPNIIHIIWDDMKYGAIGHPMLNNVTGYKSPNINKLAAEGLTFTRMYSEPSCTPTRVAAMTGRYPVRSGMIFPIFPIHRMGLPGSEVTIAEVLDDDYNTGFFEKSHFGDQEEAYLHNQGFDEAIFTLYNQFAGQMFTPEAEEKFFTLGWQKDEWDRYAIDQHFRPVEWMWAVEGFEGQRGKEIATPRVTAEYLQFNAMAYERVKAFIKKHATEVPGRKTSNILKALSNIPFLIKNM